MIAPLTPPPAFLSRARTCVYRACSALSTRILIRACNAMRCDGDTLALQKRAFIGATLLPPSEPLLI